VEEEELEATTQAAIDGDGASGGDRREKAFTVLQRWQQHPSLLQYINLQLVGFSQ
jgi:hypothetical protein